MMHAQKSFISYLRKESNSPQAKKFPDYLSYIKEAFYVAWFFSLTVGGLILSLYLASENIFPKGISLGDYFLLILVALMFGLVMLAGTLIGATNTYWFVFLLTNFKWLHKKTSGIPAEKKFHDFLKNKHFAIASGVSCIITIVIIIEAQTFKTNINLFNTTFYFFLLGLGILIICFTRQREKISMPRRALLFISITFSVMISAKPMLLDLTMLAAGIRSWPGQLITMTNEDKSKVLGVAKSHGFFVEFCETIGKNQPGTTNAQIIWPGIGDNSYIKLSEGEGLKKKTLIIPLSKEVKSYPSRNTAINCLKDSPSET